jgi:hypothetical protein
VVLGVGGECWVDGGLFGEGTQRRVVVDEGVVLEGWGVAVGEVRDYREFWR